MNEIWKLRAAAVMWLRYERQCRLVALERGLGYGTPDVVGVTRKRFMIEIEIKQTMADFRKNALKWGMKHRASSVNSTGTLPRQFYFLVHPQILEAARAELPSGFGLLSYPLRAQVQRVYNDIRFPIVHVKAPADPRARPLTALQMGKMAAHQSGTLSSVLGALAKFVDRHPGLKARNS